MYQARTFEEALGAALKVAGIEGRVRAFHDLRHTAITNDAAAGANPIALMTKAGHADMKTTKSTCSWQAWSSGPKLTISKSDYWESTTAFMQAPASCREIDFWWRRHDQLARGQSELNEEADVLRRVGESALLDPRLHESPSFARVRNGRNGFRTGTDGAVSTVTCDGVTERPGELFVSLIEKLRLVGLIRSRLVDAHRPARPMEMRRGWFFTSPLGNRAVHATIHSRMGRTLYPAPIDNFWRLLRFYVFFGPEQVCRYNPPPMSGDRFKLEVQEREERGSRHSRRLRKAGIVPGVLYGKGHARAISVPERDLRTAMTGPSGLHAILDVVLEGQTTVHPSILAEYQQDPVRGKISHIDLREVRLDQPIQASVVVQLVGEAVGAKAGGVVSLVSRELQVEALPMDVPEHIDVDVTAMDIGDVLRLEDISVPAGSPCSTTCTRRSS